MMCVLLVDDEPFVRDVLRRIVEKNGFACHAASSGAQAISLLTEHREIDLVILDAFLPDTSSVSLFWTIKDVRPSVKVIVCSGMGDEGPAKAIRDAGADDLISKPFTARDLTERMRLVLA